MRYIIPTLIYIVMALLSSYKEGGTVLAHFTSASVRPWKSLVVHSDKFSFMFRSQEGDTNSQCWGYRFHVSVIKGLQWLCERDVLMESSLEWACWVLQFLLNEGRSIQAVGAVHNIKVYDALVSYLRTPGAPYKYKILALLTQLLQTPHLFPSDALPDLNKILCLQDTIVNVIDTRLHAEEEGEQNGAGRMMLLSSNMQALIEVITTARMFNTITATSASRNIFDDMMLAVHVADHLLTNIYNSQVAGATHSVNNTHAIPSKAKFLHDSRVYFQSSHPHEGHTTSGEVNIETAKSLTLVVDLRSKLANGTSIVIKYTNTQDGGNTPVEVTITSDMLSSERRGRNKYVYEVKSNSFKWTMMVTLENPARDWGFAVTVVGNQSSVYTHSLINEEHSFGTDPLHDDSLSSVRSAGYCLREVDISLVSIVNDIMDGGLWWPSDVMGSQYICVDMFIPLSKEHKMLFPLLDTIPSGVRIMNHSRLYTLIR